MWVSSYRWERMCWRIDRCEKRITMQQEMMEQKVIEIVRKLLDHPDGLSKAIESQESIEQFIDEFIQSGPETQTNRPARDEKIKETVRGEKMERLTGTDIHQICTSNGWFTCGGNEQYKSVMRAADNGMDPHDIAVAIWICSDAIALEDIEGKIKDYLRWERPLAEGERETHQDIKEILQDIEDDLGVWGRHCRR